MLTPTKIHFEKQAELTGNIRENDMKKQRMTLRIRVLGAHHERDTSSWVTLQKPGKSRFFFTSVGNISLPVHTVPIYDGNDTGTGIYRIELCSCLYLVI